MEISKRPSGDKSAPLVNACKPPGEWQTLDAIFLSPRFDSGGKKIANAKTNFTAYQNNEIDYTDHPAPAELKIAQGDPDLSKQIFSSNGDFRTFYLFFDVNTPPFDNLKVRQAFSHIVDRDAIRWNLEHP